VQASTHDVLRKTLVFGRVIAPAAA